MSDISIALIGAAVGAGIGIVGTLSAVLLDNCLRSRGEFNRELEKTKLEVYDRLYKLYVGVRLLAEEGKTLPPITGEERGGYEKDLTGLVYEIRDLLLRTDIPQTESILRLLVKVAKKEYTEALANGLEAVRDKVASGIRNQRFLTAVQMILEEDEQTNEMKLRELTEKDS